jgi:uncharacterized protein with HEPN domain
MTNQLMNKFFSNYQTMNWKQLECMINLIISSYDSYDKSMESKFSKTEFDYVNQYLFMDLARINDSKNDMDNIRVIFILD